MFLGGIKNNTVLLVSLGSDGYVCAGLVSVGCQLSCGDDDFFFHLDVLVIPPAALTAMTSLRSFRLISMCVSWHCHLHREVNVDFNMGLVAPKASDEVVTCSRF